MKQLQIWSRYDLADPKAQNLVRLITESIQVALLQQKIVYHFINLGGKLEVSVCNPLEPVHRTRMDRMEQAETG